LREEYRLSAFTNRVLRKILGPKGDEVTGGWRKLHNEFLNLYSSSNIIITLKSRRMRWTGHVAWMERRAIIGEKVTRRETRDHWEDQDVGG
jgi:hypothetical protein